MSDFLEHTDIIIKEHIKDIPGIGSVQKRFTIAASVTKKQIEDLNSDYGIDVEAMTKNALRNECASNLCSTLLKELNKITPQECTLEEALSQLKKEDTEIIVTKGVLMRLYSMDLIAPFVENSFVASKQNSVPTIDLAGSIGNVKVYLDMRTDDVAEGKKMFIVRENVLSLLSTSDGISTNDEEIKYMVEGHYILASSDKNQYFKIS